MPDLDRESFALQVANSSFQWYRTASIRSRRLHRSSEIAILVLSAGVPVSTVLFPGVSAWPAVLGSLVVVVGGLRSIFHWQENYLRFSRSREAIEAERRRYHAAIGGYADPSARAASLIESVSRIEQEEMSQWLTVASPSRSTGEQSND